MVNLHVEMIRVDSIIVNISRQREDKDVSDILPSIAKHGVITPIIVTTNIDGDITLIAGERRLLASKQAGLKEYPCPLPCRSRPSRAPGDRVGGKPTSEGSRMEGTGSLSPANPPTPSGREFLLDHPPDGTVDKLP